MVVCLVGIVFGEAQAQWNYIPQWITKELNAGRYKLSTYEESGMNYCRVGEAKIIDMEFKDEYVLIIFEHAPRLT